MILRYPSDIDARILNPGTFVFLICEDGSEHRGEMSLRKAGLEVRDSIRWFHGSPVRHLTVVVGRKPVEGTVAENVLKYGCGGLNIDGCRIGTFTNTTPSGVNRRNQALCEMGYRPNPYAVEVKAPSLSEGRFPANIIHDGGCGSLFPDNRPSSLTGRADPSASHDPISTALNKGIISFASRQSRLYADSGSAARFFYVAESEAELIEYLERLVKA
jgi:site-specific DNA-methyltransferase (adenine-specific)